jgi:Uncharacterized conserved protein (DUF2278)
VELAMALKDGYGVVVGSVSHHRIEPPDAEGRWPHYQIWVDTPAGEYECVVNLKSRTQTKIEYRDFRNVPRERFAHVISKPSGFHQLASSPTSGALDVVRHPGLQDRGCTRWWRESGLNAVRLIEYYLDNLTRLYVFGEPYVHGFGVHNVHMNQGDPIGSEHAIENAIWQDGGLIFEYRAPQPRLSVLLTKFQTQSLQTDNAGRPIGS